MTNHTIHEVVKGVLEEQGPNADLNFLDTSLITDMDFLFWKNRNFNGRIDQWDTSNVTDMSHMFERTRFNQDIGDWEVLNAKDAYGVFEGNIAFDQDLGYWDWIREREGLPKIVKALKIKNYRYY